MMVHLLPCTVETLRAIANSTLETASGLKVAHDYPNREFYEVISSFIAQRKQEPELDRWSFIVQIEPENLVIGDIGAKSIPRNGEIEIGYGICESFRGRGLATLALSSFIQICRESRQISRIKAETLITNAPSMRVLEKAGFQKLQKYYTDEGEALLWVLDLGSRKL